MTAVRQIRKIYRSKPTIEGAGVHLNRAIGYDHVPQFDPFLLLDDFIPIVMNTQDELRDAFREFNNGTSIKK